MNSAVAIRAGGVDLRTPVILASGCAGYGPEWGELVDFAAVGAVVLKGVAREPWLGNPPPRLMETPCGVLNAIGLENVGLDVFLTEKLPAAADLPCAVVANVVGREPEEYREVCAALDGEGRLAALELNVSCPNVRAGGMAFCADADGLREFVARCREVTTKPLWVKLAPMLTDIVPAAKAALAGGAEALTVANTLPAMAVDVRARRPVLGNVYGGLSGPAIRPVTLRLVHRVYDETGAEVIASGGVDGWEAAAAYVLAGARAVQVGTALFDNPALPAEIVAGLEEYIRREMFDDVAALVGKLRSGQV
ncbi:MAG: dihydroorotate dehydrogenase [Candidatus Coatesbacteria bacterium]|nr:MAG: dihydroorotate dehydrogenase [Candidatus Coatesbacteria bacterium]